MSGNDYCQYCRADLDVPEPSHGVNCPAYRGEQRDFQQNEHLRDALVRGARVTLVVEGVARTGTMLECITKLGEGTKLVVLLDGSKP